MERNPDKFWNPYLAGVALGLVLLASFSVMGVGLGASGASLRMGVAAVGTVAPGFVEGTPGLAKAWNHGHPFDDWLVFEVLGVLLGGFVGAYTSGRLKVGDARAVRTSRRGSGSSSRWWAGSSWGRPPA